jgi:hypothetical protein
VIRVDVLPDQRHLAHAGGREVAYLIEDLFDRPRDLGAARVRNDAERAELVAAFLHGDEGRHPPRAGFRGARRRQERELVLHRELGLDRPRLARQQLGEPVIALRTDHEIDHRRAAHDLLTLGLGDATRDCDRDVAPVRARLALHHAQAAELGIDLFGRLLADVAGVQDDEVRVLRRGGLDVPLGCQQVRHTMGIVDVHLATVGFDVKLALLWHPHSRAFEP